MCGGIITRVNAKFLIAHEYGHFVQAKRFSLWGFNYGSVQLENQGPIHLTSTRDSLKILSLLR